jgi:hypothetical protein
VDTPPCAKRHGHASAPAAPPCAPRFVIVSAIATSSGSGRTAESRDAERQTGHYGNDSVHRDRCRTKARLRARRHVGPARGLIRHSSRHGRGAVRSPPDDTMIIMRKPFGHAPCSQLRSEAQSQIRVQRPSSCDTLSLTFFDKRRRGQSAVGGGVS